MQKIRTTVRIAGRDFTITGYDPEDYVRRVALFVDRKIQEMAMATRRPETEAAVLTAVTIADDLLKAQDDNNRLRRELMEAHREIETLKSKMTQSGEDIK